MKAKRIMALLTSAILTVSVLSACASSPKDNTLEQPTEEVTSAPAEDIGGSDSGKSEVTTEAVSEETVQESTAAEAEETKPEETTVVTEPQVTTVPETTPAETTQVTTTAATEATTTAAPVTTPATTTLKVDSASGKMYAKSSVNVRKGPGTEYERAGHLDTGDEVEITGVCENGWYRIKFKGGECFVSGKYLVKDKPAVTTAATTVTATAAVTTAASVTSKTEITKEDDKMTQIKNEIWLATWGSAMLVPGDDKIPKNPTLANNTLRQQIRVSVGGEKLRLVISNEFGRTGLEIKSIKIAKLDDPKSYKIDLDSQKTLTYNSKASFTVPAGKRITTDVLDFEFDELDDLAITIKLGSVPSTLTSHTASRCSTWIVKGDHVSDNSYTGFEEMTSWYFIARLDTMASKDSGAIVCLGDSLTDGASVTDNAFARYTDELARQLQKDEKLNNLSVVNMGIGATALYTYGNLDSGRGKDRVQRDVLDTPGVKYCVLFYGVNDIGAAGSDISGNIIKEYKSIIERCHKQGIKVIGVTITPFKGNPDYYNDLRESIRKKVNEFILSDDSGFDACIDMSPLVASKADPEKMSPSYVSPWGDYLHFNHQGYRLIGKTVYEHLKEFIG